MDTRNEKVLAENIRATIRRWRADQTTGASVACLKQCVSTRGLTCHPAMYHGSFADIAKRVAVAMRFNLYD